MREPEPAQGTPSEGLAPLIVTLRMDPSSAAHFTALRTAYFPAHRNWLDAHVTLFHALPGGAFERVVSDLRDVTATASAFVLQTDRILFLGAGVAYALSSQEAVELRAALALRWDMFLTRQDRAWKGALHVTVQNKVMHETARALHDQLVEGFVAREVLATGVDLWHYDKGPWRHAMTVDFVE